MLLPRTRDQILATLRPVSAGATGALFAAVVEIIVDWMGTGLVLPAAAHVGRSFETETPERLLRVIAVGERGLWAARIIVVGSPGADGGRGRWTHDIALATSNVTSAATTPLLLGVRSTYAAEDTADEAAGEARPVLPLLVELAQRFELREAGRISPVPWMLATEADLQTFQALLTDPARRLPVYVLTRPVPGSLGVETADYLLDAARLARECLGLAYVALLPPPAGFALSDQLGKRWSAYLGAVRTYRPELDFTRDDPTDHPLVMAERILRTEYRGDTGEAAYLRLLVDQARRNAVAQRIDWGALRFLEDARLEAASVAREAATAPEERAARSDDEVAALRERLARADEERDIALTLAEETEAERDRMRAENTRLTERLDALRAAYLARTGEPPDAGIEPPRDFDSLPTWIDQHLAGRLVLHPRAVRGLRDAAYRDIDVVARALTLLADSYRNQKLGHPGAHRVFEAGTQELGLRIGRSIARHRAGEEGETYFVRWPPSGGHEEFLEWHLRKGSGKDPRHCLAIYFFWDESARQVVVGWLPSHLENRMT